MSIRWEWITSVALLALLGGITLGVIRGGGEVGSSIIRDTPTSPKPSPAPGGPERDQTHPSSSSLQPLASSLPGWQTTLSERYDASNLHVKIDGRAGLYLDYAFQSLDFEEAIRTGSDSRMEVYRYGHATPLDAFGIYSAEKPAGAQVVPVGKEGYIAGQSLFFWKGCVYVQMMWEGIGEDQVMAWAQACAESITDSGDAGDAGVSAPEFPGEGLVAGSLTFVKSSPLGMEILPPGFTASYQVEDTSFTGYLADSTSGRQKLLDDVSALFKKMGKSELMTLSGHPCVLGAYADMSFLFSFNDDAFVGAGEITGDIGPAKEFMRGLLDGQGGSP